MWSFRTKSLMLVFTLVALAHSTISMHSHPKHQEFEMLNDRYELISIKFTMGHKKRKYKSISFSAFGIDYNLPLYPTTNLVLNKIKHTQGLPKGTSGIFTSSWDACHYHTNRVLSSPPGVFGGVSLCQGRGLRARIITHNDTLKIFPANYYFNSSVSWHDISHTHLVWRMSDFDTNNNNNNRQEQHQKTFETNNNVQNDEVLIKSFASDTKRRLEESENLINGGIQNTELFVICDDSMYLDYFNEYGSNWYEELVMFVADIVHYVNDDYKNTDWGPAIGTINVGLAEIDVITSYTGPHAMLSPQHVDNNASLAFSMGHSLGQLKSFVATYKDTSTFDHAMLLTHHWFSSGGLAYGKSMCYGSGWSSSVSNAGYISAVKVISHELGHSFNAPHDQDTTCGNDGGIMGYGWNDFMFSSCTRNIIANYIQYECPNNCSCLADTMSWSPDYPDASEINYCNLTAAPECIDLVGFPNISSMYDDFSLVDVNGEYSVEGCFQGFPYYVNLDTNFLLYYSPRYENYVVFKTKSVANHYALCEYDDDITSVTCPEGWWMIYEDNTWTWDDSAYSAVPSYCYGDCVQVSGLESLHQSVFYDLSGTYKYSGQHNGYPLYQRVYDDSSSSLELQLFRYNSNYWVIGESESSRWAFCSEEDVMLCNENEWEVWREGWGHWDTNATMSYTSCTLEPTALPTESPTLPTHAPTMAPTSDCVEITGLQVQSGTTFYDLSGVYTFAYLNQQTGYAVYNTFIEGIEWKLHYYESWQGYSVGRHETSGGWAFCEETDPTRCKANMWEVFWDAWGVFDVDAECHYTACSPTRRMVELEGLFSDEIDEIKGKEEEWNIQDVNIDELDNCVEFDCIILWGFEINSNEDYDLNNRQWIADGCMHGWAKYYTTDLDGQKFYLYRDFGLFNNESDADAVGATGAAGAAGAGAAGQTGVWTIGSDAYNVHVAFCESENLIDCNGRWYNFDSDENEWYINHQSYVEICVNDFFIDDGCANEYGESICLYADNKDWMMSASDIDALDEYYEYPDRNGDADENEYLMKFVIGGCKNGDSAYFYYENEDTGVVHYLSNFVEDGTFGTWQITRESIQSYDSIALCDNSVLNECDQGAWKIKTLEKDVIKYVVDWSLKMVPCRRDESNISVRNRFRRLQGM